MPCEVAVKSVVPAIRAGLAKELIKTRKLKQNDIADLLGITQTAVSKYARNVRGRIINIEEIEEVQQMMTETVEVLVNGRIPRDQLVDRVCEICKLVRQKGLMCVLCKRSNPSLDINKCHICMDPSDASKCLSNC